VRLPEAAAAVECYLTIQRAEALDVHRRAGLFPERLDGYSDDVRRHLEAATAVDLPAYLEAWRLRRELSAGFKRIFAEVDLLASPVAACSPFVIGDDELRHHGRARTLRELVLPFTVPQDLAGLPACTIRAGFDASGCPVALQLTGPRGGEAGVLRAVTALWDASPELQRRRPELEASAAAGQDAASGSSFPTLNAAERP
jgi:aspartyl-tRNA(Asn)/glutamyl-tRNA(Gln) amidotransferase subunit A